MSRYKGTNATCHSFTNSPAMKRESRYGSPVIGGGGTADDTAATDVKSSTV